MPDVKEALERLRPVLGNRAGKLWALYITSDRDDREQLEHQIRLLDLRANRTGPGSGPAPLPPPEPGVLDGWLRLGEVIYPGQGPAPFGLGPGELIQHVGIFGRSGAGKTNTVLGVIRGLLSRKVPFLVFDWKRNYRDLLAAPWVREGEVLAFTAGRDLAPLHLNPLRPPPGTEPRTWLKKLIEIIAHAYFLGEGVMYLLQEALESCYEASGVFAGGSKYPTFHDVLRYLRSRKVNGREANWMASTLRAIGSLTYGPMSDTVCAHEPIDLRSLLEKNVVLELDALTDSDKVFLVEALFLYIHHLRLAEETRERLKHVLVVEEAHHVFLRSKQETSSGEPITDVILREIRELGEGVVLIDQHPSLIAVTALGNTYCTVAMNLKHRADVNTVADACLLDPEQREHLGRLPVGHAVVKLQDRWASPFIVRFPIVGLRKGAVSDAVVLRQAQRPAKIAGNTVVPPRGGLGTDIPEIPVSPESPDSGPISTEARRLLEDVRDHPTSGVTDRYRRLEISRRKGTELKRDLQARGLVTFVDVPLPGGRVTLLELTDSACVLLGASRESRRKGGVVHRYWVDRVAARLVEEGYDVVTEAGAGGGRAIDLVGRRGNRQVAVEVEVSGRRMEESLTKLRESSADRRVLACASAETLARARALVGSGEAQPPVEVLHVWGLTSEPASRRRAGDVLRGGPRAALKRPLLPKAPDPDE